MLREEGLLMLMQYSCCVVKSRIYQLFLLSLPPYKVKAPAFLLYTTATHPYAWQIILKDKDDNDNEG